MKIEMRLAEGKNMTLGLLVSRFLLKFADI